MNELQIFENAEFGQVRTVTIDNEPWFVGKDVATALGYKNTKIQKMHLPHILKVATKSWGRKTLPHLLQTVWVELSTQHGLTNQDYML